MLKLISVVLFKTPQPNRCRKVHKPVQLYNQHQGTGRNSKLNLNWQGHHPFCCKWIEATHSGTLSRSFRNKLFSATSSPVYSRRPRWMAPASAGVPSALSPPEDTCRGQSFGLPATRCLHRAASTPGKGGKWRTGIDRWRQLEAGWWITHTHTHTYTHIYTDIIGKSPPYLTVRAGLATSNFYVFWCWIFHNSKRFFISVYDFPYFNYFPYLRNKNTLLHF